MRTHFFLATAILCGCSSTSEPAAVTLPDAATSDAGITDGGGCSSAMQELLKPVDAVSPAEVTVLASDASVRTLFVDATAGGSQQAAQSPRVYLNLESGTKVQLSDVAAKSSTEWDLAIKRPVLFTNVGHGGPGQGGAVFLPGKGFAEVTAADGADKTYATETFLDTECNPIVDQIGSVKTSFDGWYDYDTSNNSLTPRAGAWLVRGGTGKAYKIEILSYYATPDGGVGQAGGRYTMKVQAL
jgi:hypothetical protein